MRHRQLHPSERALEPRFCRPVEPVVEHRLEPLLQAQLLSSLEHCRAGHQAIHEASATLAEAIEHQSDLRFTARQQLASAVAAASMALEVLR
jgi:hypothetical protein